MLMTSKKAQNLNLRNLTKRLKYESLCWRKDLFSFDR